MVAYHVLLRTSSRPGKLEFWLRDISLPELKRRFLNPYMRSDRFFSDGNILNPGAIREVRIVKTKMPWLNLQEHARCNATTPKPRPDGGMTITYTAPPLVDADILFHGQEVTLKYISDIPGVAPRKQKLAKRPRGETNK